MTQTFRMSVSEAFLYLNLITSAMSPAPSWVAHIAMNGTADSTPIYRRKQHRAKSLSQLVSMDRPLAKMVFKPSKISTFIKTVI